MRVSHALALGLVGIAAWMWARPAAASVDEEPAPTGGDFGLWDEILTMTQAKLGLWVPPAEYAGMIAAAEAQYGIPTNMLARLLYQESHYRDDIINGETASPAGALGIAQFMPGTAAELGIDPLDPEQAIPAAALYLRRQFNRFGDWAMALAAYNWGGGNVARKGLAAAPTETRLYYTSILSDIGMG